MVGWLVVGGIYAYGFDRPFLAAPYPLPENMITALGGDVFVDTMIRKWAGASPTSQSQISIGIDVYKSYFKKSSVIAASCADYRAGALVDAPEQEKDQKEGRKVMCPTLVVYSEAYMGTRYNVREVWNDWVDGSKGAKLRTLAVGNGAGHFFCEEVPEEVTKGVVGWIREVLGVDC